MAPGTAAKRLELLKVTMPGLSRVLVLSYLTDPIAAPQVDELKIAARALGLRVQIRDIRTPDDLPAAFDAGIKEGAQALLPTAESIFSIHRVRVIELAARHKLPAIYPSRFSVDAGGLMSYGADFPALWARAATYVDKILKGARPADLPVEQPTRFEMIVNLRAAKAFGLTIPSSVLARADQILQ